MRYIGFEGPIGAGKTTLVRALEKRLNGKVILEQADENPFLDLFYQDKERYAFQTQIFFLLSRYQQQRQILQGDLFHEYFLGDYVFSRDTIFARMTLNEDELGLYSTIYNALVEQIPKPDLVVYLRAKPDTLMERVRMRGKDYEAGMQVDYLRELCEIYEDFFRHYDDTRLLVLDTDELDYRNNPEELDSVCDLVLETLNSPANSRGSTPEALEELQV
jgi:deoxyadenosine/deoxycytidine kinase